MNLSLIAAMAENRVIGFRGDMPWHLPMDLRRFKQLTWGHTLIMGRKTFDAIGKALPGRRTLVLSRQAGYEAPGAEVVGTPALALAEAADDDQPFIAGGAQIYRLFAGRATRLYLTRVHGWFAGDSFFPPLPMGEWQLVTQEHHPADDRHPWPCTFQVYHRLPGPVSEPRGGLMNPRPGGTGPR